MFKLGRCVCLFWFIAVFNAQASETLDSFYKEVNSLEAEFEQVVVDGQGLELSRTSGRVYLQRPGKFRWSYAPEDGLELGQQIIADGVTVSIYDADLEQLVMRSYRDASLQVPSLLLVGKGGDIDQYFEVSELNGGARVVLTPSSEDASYAYLGLSFDKDLLIGIEMQDAIGNITSISLTKVVQNQALDRDRFQFIPPPGTDIIRN